MKFKYVVLPLFLLLLLAVGGCNSEQKCPLEAQLTRAQGRAARVELTSVVDTITIQAVTANRGNFEVNSHRDTPLPHTLKFGEQYYLSGSNIHLNLKELEVQTDKGAWTFTFNK